MWYDIDSWHQNKFVSISVCLDSSQIYEQYKFLEFSWVTYLIGSLQLFLIQLQGDQWLKCDAWQDNYSLTIMFKFYFLCQESSSLLCKYAKSQIVSVFYVGRIKCSLLPLLKPQLLKKLEKQPQVSRGPYCNLKCCFTVDNLPVLQYVFWFPLTQGSSNQQYSSYCARLPLKRGKWKYDVAHQQEGMRCKFHSPTFSLQQWAFLKWLPECLWVIIVPVLPGWELVAEAAQRYRKTNRALTCAYKRPFLW